MIRWIFFGSPPWFPATGWLCQPDVERLARCSDQNPPSLKLRWIRMDQEMQIPQYPCCIPSHAACKPERSAGFSWVEFVRFSIGCRKETDKTMEDEKDFMIFLDSKFQIHQLELTFLTKLPGGSLLLVANWQVLGPQKETTRGKTRLCDEMNFWHWNLLIFFCWVHLLIPFGYICVLFLSGFQLRINRCTSHLRLIGDGWTRKVVNGEVDVVFFWVAEQFASCSERRIWTTGS